MEEWKQINGFPNYLISNNGYVFSNNINKIMSPSLDGSGNYYRITLCKNGGTYEKQIHKLVAEHFVENKDGKPEVNHKDHNSHNNIYTNLEFVTRRENMLHCFELYSQVRNFRECVLIRGDEVICEFKSINEACAYARDILGLSYSTLNKYRKVGEYKIVKKGQTTISKESTSDDKLLMEVPTT